jgi:four helix bundle protein
LNEVNSMENFAEEFRTRTKKQAIDIIRFCKTLPKSDEAYIVKKQIIRSSTSVAANYRAACRARSENEFFSKLSIVVEEADETVFWLEIIRESEIDTSKRALELLKESEEVLKIVSKSRKTLKDKKGL